MWAAVEPGLQPEVVLPDLRPSAGVDYLKAQGFGKPEGEMTFTGTTTVACELYELILYFSEYTQKQNEMLRLSGLSKRK